MSTLALVALEKFGQKVDVGGGERKQSNGCVILVAKGDTDPPVTLQWLQEGVLEWCNMVQGVMKPTCKSPLTYLNAGCLSGKATPEATAQSKGPLLHSPLLGACASFLRVTRNIENSVYEVTKNSPNPTHKGQVE